MTARRVLAEVRAERDRQDAKWGEQNHHDGTGYPMAYATARAARFVCQQAARLGSVTWRGILHEEVAV